MNIIQEPSTAHPFAGEHPLADVSGTEPANTHNIFSVSQYDHHQVIHGIPIASQYNNPREVSEMTAFCDLLEQRGLSEFVRGVFYDSKADICTFEFNGPLRTFDGNEPDHLYTLAHRILVVALETIYQFDWFGYAEHGKPYDEELERFVRETEAETKTTAVKAEQGQGAPASSLDVAQGLEAGQEQAQGQVQGERE